MHEHELKLRPLLNYLAQYRPVQTVWDGWHIRQMSGGANNLLYRTTRNTDDFAVKFTIRDLRDRAGREYRALTALAQVGYGIAPQPILLDQASYAHPVVVQTWIVGDPFTLPATDDDWYHLVEHLATIHTLTPADTTVRLTPAVLAARSPDECRQLIQEQLKLIPLAAQPAALHDLVHRLEPVLSAPWPPTPSTLCRNDPNSPNFIRRPTAWASVDWENSGWSDPAFEIADLISHPAYRTVPLEHWHGVIHTYCSLVHDATAATRIEVYYKTLLVWWVARFVRTLYEVPLSLDQRLVERPANWAEETQAKCEYYVHLAQTLV
ncbi:MAG: aminoglycoside phosphotransferase family protein [Chloroflexota bacterium]|nr:aminoglycoside phosphotransferase family protein [Chloroflexota bacterium]